MNKLKALIAALKVFVLAKEPSLTVGSVTGAAAAVTEWIQTNQITNGRTLVAFAAPIVLSYVIRQFVVPAQSPKVSKA